MSIRELSENLINQIAAGEVIERPASVVKELVENALDAGAGDIVIDVADGGRTLISVIDNGSGMSRDDLAKSILRHATSKLPNDDLLNINFMGFRGEALPSIASVSDMKIDTFDKDAGQGFVLDCNSMEIKPSAWESGSRVQVLNLFSKTPARLKFMRSDRAEMMSVVGVIKQLAMARPDVGFVLNNKWFFPKGQSLEKRIEAVVGEDISDKMLNVKSNSKTINGLNLYGFISKPTFRRASSVDQYLFVNGRSVKDKILVGALRAAYMDVMHGREFPICALFLELDNQMVDVNVSPAKTDVHFLEPSHIRSFIIKTLRSALSETMIERMVDDLDSGISFKDFDRNIYKIPNIIHDFNNDFADVIKSPKPENHAYTSDYNVKFDGLVNDSEPLGRVIGQIGNKYILSEISDGLVILDQHAAHERLVYEKLRRYEIKKQPLLSPIIINLKPEYIDAVMELQGDMEKSGVLFDKFGIDAIAIFEKPSNWDFDWQKLFESVAQEVLENGYSVIIGEKMHLKLANYACHHSVRAGQKLDFAQMNQMLRDVENTGRAGQCNHGRPVYKIFKYSNLDALFERI